MPNTVVGKGGVVRTGTAEELLQKARLKLLLGDLRAGKQGWGFFGTLAMYLNPRPMTAEEEAWYIANGMVPTLGTDGKELVYSRNFIEDPQLTTNMRVFLWAHEAMHLALQHPWRARPLARRAAALKGIPFDNAFRLSNVAADYVVNQVLVDNGMEPPKGALLDARWSGMTMESVFWKIVEDAEKHADEQTLDNHMEPADGKDNKDGKGKGKGGSGSGDPQDGDGKDRAGSGSGDPQGKGKGRGKGRGQDQQPPQQEADSGGSGSDQSQGDGSLGQDLRSLWEDRTRQAALAADGRGNLPAEIRRWVEELNNPTLPWQYMLARYLLEKSKSDYKWNPPNRRFVAQGLYLPSMISDKIRLALGVDTSGSVDEEELRAFLSEVQGICHAFEDYEICLIGCDAAVHDCSILTPADDLAEAAFTGGGGGTSFAPFFEKLEELDFAPAVAVYLTDGDGWCNCDTPPYPVLWVINNSQIHNLPFGEQIEMTAG